jgi:hypothetical protein
MAESVEVDFRARLDDMQRAVGQLKGQMNSLGASVRAQQGAFAGIGKEIKSMVLAAVSLGTVTNFLKQAADGYDRIAKLSTQTGMSVEFLQKLAHTADLSGASLETAAKAANKFAKEIHFGSETGAAAKAVEELGLKIEDLRGMSPDEMFEKVGVAIANVENPMQRAAVAMTIFGRSGTELLPTLEAMRNGLEVNGSLTEEQIRNIEAVNDMFTRLKQQIVAGFGQILAAARKPLEYIGKGWNVVTMAIGESIASIERFTAAMGRAWEAMRSGDFKGALEGFAKDAKNAREVMLESIQQQFQEIWNESGGGSGPPGGSAAPYMDDGQGPGNGGEGKGGNKPRPDELPSEKALREYLEGGEGHDPTYHGGAVRRPGELRQLRRRAELDRAREERRKERGLGGETRTSRAGSTGAAEQLAEQRFGARQSTMDAAARGTKSAAEALADERFGRKPSEAQQGMQDAAGETSPGAVRAREEAAVGAGKTIGDVWTILNQRLPERVVKGKGS